MRHHPTSRHALLTAATVLALALSAAAGAASADETDPEIETVAVEPHDVGALAEPDPNPPVVRNTVPTNGAVYAAGTEITVAFECFDPDDPITYCAQYSHELGEVVRLEPGTYHWRFYAENARAEVIYDALFTVMPYDSTPPVLTLTRPDLESTGWHRGHPQYVFNATDNSGSVRWVVLEYADGSHSVVPGRSQSKTFTEEGVQEVQVFAVDWSGNTSAPMPVSVPVDTVAPALTLTPSIDPTGLEVGTPLSVVPACSDATSGVASCPAARTLDTTVPGTFSVEFEATDVAGHHTVVEFAYDVLEPDEQAPALTLRASAPNALGWYDGPLEATLAADDGAGRGVDSIEWSVTGPEADGGVSSQDVLLLFAHDGTHTLTASAVDVQGNRSAVETFTVRIDATAPVVDTATRLRFVQGTTPDFSTLCSDALSGVVSCGIAGSMIAAAPGSTETLGEHTVVVEAEDAAGNAAGAQITYEVVAAPKGVSDAAEPEALAATGSSGLALGSLLAGVLLALGAAGFVAARRLG